MRILIVRSNSVSPDSRVEKEAMSLLKAGFSVIVLGLDRSRNHNWNQDVLALGDERVPVYRIGIRSSFGGGFRNLIPMLKFSLELKKWLKKNRHLYDCVHACDLDTGYVTRLVARKMGFSYIYDIFDYYSAAHSFPNIIRKWVISMERKVIDDAYCTIICSEKRKEQIVGASPNKIVVIHNSPSKSLYKNGDSSFPDGCFSSGDRCKIGYVGILSKSRLIEELVSIVCRRNDLELHIGGFGQLESFVLEKAKTNANIFYYGKLPYQSTLVLENEMDLLTAIYDPSVENHKYAAPNKFYEAIMLGKPIIMVHNTGFDAEIESNKLGVLINYTEDGLEEGIDRLISMRSSWNEIKLRGQSLFNELYSWDIMEERLVSLYSGLCESKIYERKK